MKRKVLVVGAGAAGVCAAFFLKYFDEKESIDVDLVERLTTEKYDLYHDMCGEAISADLIDEISPLKPKGILDKIELIREHWPGDIQIDTEMEGFLINRGEFFKSIIHEFEKLGGKIENKSATGVVNKGEKVQVQVGRKEKTYDYVIAADGANSKIRKDLGVTGNTRKFLQYIIDKKPQRGVLEFFYDEKYKGDYMWIFPHENNTKIGFPFDAGKMFQSDDKIIKKQTRAIGYGGVNKYVVGRVLFVGDAACQTNPITKGGIRAGMLAGKMAAEAILDETPETYEKDWLKTAFSSNIFMESFLQLQKMNNKMMEDHISPFKNINPQSIYQRSILNLKILLFYRKYISLYKAYELSNKVGW